MKTINFGTFTSEETEQAVKDGMRELIDAKVTEIIIDWAKDMGWTDELIAQLESDDDGDLPT